MEEINHNGDDVLVRIVDDLEGNLSPEEKLKLDQWRVADPINEKTYQDFRWINEEMNLLSVRQNIDADTSWQAFESKLPPPTEGSLKRFAGKPDHYFSSKWWTGIAASLFLCFCYYIYDVNIRTSTITTAHNQHKNITLPDGSNVVLNENTVISYIRGNFEKKRNIELLEGEAFFNVKHDPRRSFSIDLGDIKAVDLGTSFNISRTNDDVDLIVRTGKVALKHSSDSREIVLSAGMRGVYLADENRLSDTPKVNINYTSWIDKKLIFVNSPLPYVVRQLEKAYHTKLTFEGRSLQKRKLTARFHYQTIDSALVILSATLQCKVKRHKNHYVLSE